jgi:UDP-glucose 4-epimerase
MTKILITGGAGFIGSHLAEGFLQAGYQVVVVDNLSTGNLSNVSPQAAFHQMDIRSPEFMALVQAEQPHIISHHAAQMSVLASLRDPADDASNNILGSLNVLASAQAVGAHLIFASSGGTVYGEPQQLPAPEDCPLLPLSPYGISKMTFEHYLRISAVPHTILRYANVYGPRQNPHGEAGVIAIFGQKMLQGQPTIIYGDGEQQRDFIYVQDVVAANLKVIESRKCGVYNIGTGQVTSVNELHHAMRQELPNAGLPTYTPAKTGEVYRNILDCRRAQQELGWQAQTDLASGLRATIAEMRGRYSLG